MISSIRDILERLDSKDPLAFFRSIYGESPVGIELYDEKGFLIDANRACLDMFGISDVSEVVGFSLFQDPNVTDEVKKKLSEGETVRYEVPFDFEKVKAKRLYETTKSGISYLDVLVTPIRIGEEGLLSGYMVHVQDISDRKRAAEELERARDVLELRVNERTAELRAANEKLTGEIAWREQVEKELRESERKLAMAQKVANLGSWEWDLAGNTVTWSEQLYRIFGVESGEFGATYDAFLKSVHPVDRGVLDKKVKEALQERKPYSIDHRIVRPDGTVIHMHSVAEVICDESGRPVLMRGTGQDITVRKLAEEALAESKAKWRSLVESVPDIVFTTDREGKILFINHTPEGLPPEEAIGTNALSYVPEEYRNTVEQALGQVFQTGKPVSYEIAARGPHDSLSWYMTRVSPLKHADSVMSALFVTRDITERKQVEEELGEYRKRLEEIVEERTHDLMRTNEELEAEIAAHKEALQALQESEKKFENLAETAPIGIVITNPAGRVMEANSSLLTLFGYSSKEELLAVPAAHHYVEPSEREQFLELMKSGTVRDLEVQLKRKDGSWFWASAASVTQSTGIDTYFITTIQDITERKKLEEELIRTQKLESLGVLAGGIAHDFNNALTAILNNITVARMSATPGDKVFKLLSAAERASLSARNLTRQLLTFSKGGDPVRKSLVLQDFLEETTRFALTGSKVVAEFDIAEDLWPVEADEGQLTQVMNNLVLNAAQAMPEGGTITVGAENVTIWKDSAMQLKEGRYVKLTVRDQGPGIPEENLHRIFDPYFTTKEGGSGLGLAISYSIVKKHGGRLGVESETGNGAVFSVYLPASDEKPVEQEARDEAPPETKGRILLLEDEALIAESLAMALSEFGYTVQHAQDGREAALRYREAHESGAPFDLVIMDLTVPVGLGGRDTLKLLREINPDVRAIATSGYSNDPVMSNYEEYGFAGVITKPYLVEELIEILQIYSP